MSRFEDLLSDFETEKHFLAILEPYDPVTAQVVKIYLSSHGFITSGSDTPPHTYFDARLAAAYTFTRALFQQGRLSGRSIPGDGSSEIVNRDGGLDYLARLAWGGRRVQFLMGGADFALSEYGVIFDGTAQGLAYSDGGITLNLRDLQYVFDREFQSLTFAGTGGLQGVESLKDKRRPRSYGVRRGVSPVYLGLDTGGRHTFALSDGPIVGVYRVLDRAVPLAQVASAASPGEWSVDLGTATLTLGGSYDGPLTVDFVGARYLSVASGSSVVVSPGSRSFAVPSVAGFVSGQRVRATASPLVWVEGEVTSTSSGLTVLVDQVSGSGTYSSWSVSPVGTTAGIARAFAASMGVASIDELSVVALDVHQPATVGIWRPEGGNGGQFLDELLDGAGCYWGFDRSGSFEVGRLDTPSEAPTLVFGEEQILEIEREETEEPNYQFTIAYARCLTTMSADQIAGAATETDRAFFLEEWRREKATSAPTLTAWPLSRPVEVQSVFDRQEDAAAEASRMVSVYASQRDYFRVRMKMQPLLLEIGDTVEINHSRYGLSAGKLLRVVDLTEDMETFEVVLGLWG